MISRSKTILYIDGFNFYYGACRRYGIRWVDPLKLCDLLLPRHEVIAIRYFSAPIKPDRGDPDKSARQNTYLRALRTLPNLSIQLGSFLQSVKKMPLYPPTQPQKFIQVLKTEEKGSDVNLATALLLDVFDNKMECAVVVSNDSDLLEPIKVVRRRFGKKVGLVNPQKRPSRVLVEEADFHKHVRRSVLAASQFPCSLVDTEGPFHKPPSW